VSKRSFFIAMPIGVNLVLALVASLFMWKFEGAPALSYWTGCATVVAGLVSIVGFLILDTHAKETLVSLGVHVVTMVLVFASIYAGYGLMQQGAPVSASWHTSLYFSIVTWTTLGYGDFTVGDELQLLAALEAMAGYVFFGLMVGVTTGLIRR
jgi:hypothetical protein